MTRRPVFLSLEQVREIHRRLIVEFGGDSSLRDEGLLESVVMMPAAQYGGDFLHSDLPAMAAAYLFHLCKSLPFLDGNKRTALAAAEVFLLVNDYQPQATNKELERLTFGVAQGKLSKDEVTALFREKCTAPS